jgi:predicted DNA-binding transcriptional regulator AlpA
VGKDQATIEDLAADPALAARLPADAIPALMGELAARQAALSAVSSALAARWMQAARSEALGADAPAAAGDSLLNVRQAAAKLNMSESWLYQNAWRFPFLVRQGGALRFSRQGLEHYLQARQAERAAGK